MGAEIGHTWVNSGWLESDKRLLVRIRERGVDMESRVYLDSAPDGITAGLLVSKRARGRHKGLAAVQDRTEQDLKGCESCVR